MKAFVFEKNKFQKRLFWLSNFPGAAILNNCDVTWLPYCSETKSDCSGTIGQPSYVTIIQARWRRPGSLKAKISVFGIYFSRIQTLSLEKDSAIPIVNIICGLKLFCCFSGGSL